MNPSSFTSLQNHFLIALPRLSDGIFAHSITYLCEHNRHGAMGIMINRPLDMQLGEILEQLDFDADRGVADEAIFIGGPVHPDRGFVLHQREGQPQWESSILVSPALALTTSLDILDAIARRKGPTKRLIALGYAGWGAGQLEQELQDNAWLCLPADEDVVFNVPAEERVDAALAKLGISFAQLGSDVGHA